MMSGAPAASARVSHSVNSATAPASDTSAARAVAGRPAAATHFERIRLGELVANAVEARRTADAAAILDGLRTLADSYVPGDPLHEQMVVNAAFLVRRDKLAEFDAGVERVSAERADRMHFKLTGPLPPFSFVSSEEPAWA